MGLFSNLRSALSSVNSAKVNNQFESDNSSLNENELALNYPVKFIGRYVNPYAIKRAMEVNPNIKRILEEHNLPVEFNISNFNSIIMSHLVPTAKTTQKI